MVYSTPTKYVAALREVNSGFKEDQAWTVRRDDAFPYAEKPNRYWSGLFSLRPNFKKMIRETYSLWHSVLPIISSEMIRPDSDMVEFILEKQK